MEINKEYYFDTKEHIKKTKSNKKQIILTNTSCTFDEYITKIKTRYNGKYTNIPCFFISNDGVIYQHYRVGAYSDLMSDYGVEKNSIIISLENVGWLHKDTLTGNVVDWKGSTYSGGFIEKSWRGKKLWSNYKDIQYTKLVELTDYLCLTHGVNREFIGTNIEIENPKKYKGILTRSNYSKNYYDLSPSFDFKKVSELINNSYE